MSLYIRDPDMNLVEVSNKIQKITVEKMFHFIVGGVYKNMGGFRKYSLVILDVSETLFSDLWGFRIYGDFEEIIR